MDLSFLSPIQDLMILQAVRILLKLREWFVHASSQCVLNKSPCTISEKSLLKNLTEHWKIASKMARGKANQKEKKILEENLDCLLDILKYVVWYNRTDMIFVKSFTQAYFPTSRNLPEENA